MKYSVKITTLIILFTLTQKFSYAQQVEVTIGLKKTIKNLCNPDEIFGLLNELEGQRRAIRPLSDEKILELLNTNSIFLKENPKFKGKEIITLVVNCEGTLVKCELEKGKSPLLREEIQQTFFSLGSWIPGQLKGEKVDSVQFIAYRVKKGVLYFKEDFFND